MQRRCADQQEITQCTEALFRYAIGSNTYTSLRAFDQFRRDVPPSLHSTPVRINGDLSLIEQATRDADRCANAQEPVVFAPPICTFTNPKRARVRTSPTALPCRSSSTKATRSPLQRTSKDC